MGFLWALLPLAVAFVGIEACHITDRTKAKDAYQDQVRAAQVQEHRADSDRATAEAQTARLRAQLAQVELQLAQQKAQAESSDAKLEASKQIPSDSSFGSQSGRKDLANSID